ncbi:Fur family transcriptional regulator [Thermocrinis minervae]|nr:Fur family transcriptional regulator [Thermocrinis minervae]
MIKDKVDLFIKACRSMGLRITPQRVAVYEVLLSRDDHPTAEEVYNEVKKRYPFVSLATVYRTIETLEQLNLVKRVAYWGNSVRYDANIQEHHHLICTKCGTIKDVSFDFGLNLPEKLYGYKVEGYSVHIYGVCPACQQKESLRSTHQKN